MGVVAVPTVTSEATQTLVNANRRAIVSGVDLPLGTGGMTLVAKGLALVGRDIHRAFSVEHLGKREIGNGNMLGRTTVQETNRRPRDFLLWTRNTLTFLRSGQHRTLPVHTMTGETWNGRLAGELNIFQQPRSSSTDRLDEIANRSLEVHPMATQAIVDQ